jgi:hypothetical protein
MTAKSMGFRTRLATPGQPLASSQPSVTRLAIAAIVIGGFAIELVAIGASLPAMLPQDLAAPVNGSR